MAELRVAEAAEAMVPPGGTHTTATMRRAQIGTMMADKLDQLHVEDELLEALQETESASLARARSTAQTNSGKCCDERARCVTFFTQAAKEVVLPGMSWFEAVRVLDTVCQCTMATSTKLHLAKEPPEVTFARAAAICEVALHADGTHDFGDSRPGPQRMAHLAFMATSHSQHVGGKAVSHQDIIRETMAVLQHMDSAPNVLTWVSIFLTRFDLVTCGRYTKHITTLKNITINLAANFLLTMPASAARETAEGCFALALVLGRVLPLTLLRPGSVTQERWVSMLDRVATQNRLASFNVESVQAEQSALHPSMMFAVLAFAMHQEVSAIKQAAFTIAVI